MRRGARDRAAIRRGGPPAVAVLASVPVLVAAVLLLAGPREAWQERIGGAPEAASGSRQVVATVTAESAGTYEPATPVRDVTGPRITAGPRPEGPLIRVPSIVELPEPPPPPEPARDRFRLVVVRHAGVIDARDRIIELRDVEAPRASTVCVNAAGRDWPCGMRARTAVRRLIRRRIIACEPVGHALAEPTQHVTTTCSVAHVDIGRWLVENGWARPADGAPQEFHALYAEARRKGLGMWRPDGR